MRLSLKLPRKSSWQAKFRKGQSLVEMAILFPVLLVVLSGLIEAGFLLNDYLTILDAARNAARFSADSDYESSDSDIYCESTRDFYRQTSCLVCVELAEVRPTINGLLNDSATDTVIKTTNAKYQFSPNNNDYFNCPLDSSQDDVIVSAVSVEDIGTASPDINYEGQFRLYNLQTSEISSSFFNNIMSGGAAAPNTGFVVVEVFYHYPHRLGLPWVNVIFPNPVPLHVYSIMPLPSAEPQPTPP